MGMMYFFQLDELFQNDFLNASGNVDNTRKRMSCVKRNIQFHGPVLVPSSPQSHPSVFCFVLFFLNFLLLRNIFMIAPCVNIFNVRIFFQVRAFVVMSE